MQDLVPCPHCQSYVRSSEVACPFCERSLAGLEATAQAATLPRGLSRSAAFAARAAVLAGFATVAACGGESEDDNAKNHSPQQHSGGSASGGTTQASGGETAAGGTAPGTGGLVVGGGGSEPDMGQGGYTPIPIYGGVFPDPELRAKV